MVLETAKNVAQEVNVREYIPKLQHPNICEVCGVNIDSLYILDGVCLGCDMKLHPEAYEMEP